MTLGMPFYTKEICKGKRRPPEIDGTTCPHESWQGCFAFEGKYSTNGELHCSLAKASYHTKDIRFAQEYIDNK